MADLMARAAQAASQRMADSEATESVRDMNSASTGTHSDPPDWVTVSEAALLLNCKPGFIRKTAAEMAAVQAEGCPEKIGRWRIYVGPMRAFLKTKNAEKATTSCYLRPQSTHRTKTLYDPNETWELKDDVA